MVRSAVHAASHACPAPLAGMQDKESQVLWWVLQGCDPEGYVPCPAEAAGKGMAASWVKNRNVILRWEALETALRQVSRPKRDIGWTAGGRRGSKCCGVEHDRSRQRWPGLRHAVQPPRGNLPRLSKLPCAPSLLGPAAGGGDGRRHAAVLAAVAERPLVVACQPAQHH